MAAKEHIFKVEMSCDGCAKTITNVLNKHKGKGGIHSFKVDVKDKTVTVKGTIDSDAILEIIQKTGKIVEYLGEKQ